MLDLNHKKMDVWKESITFTKKLYSVTEYFPRHEKYGIVSQMRRAAVSVSSNISEGASRFSKRERVRFFEIARSSLVELDTQLELSIELGYLEITDLKKIDKQINILFALLSKLIVNSK